MLTFVSFDASVQLRKPSLQAARFTASIAPLGKNLHDSSSAEDWQHGSIYRSGMRANMEAECGELKEPFARGTSPQYRELRQIGWTECTALKGGLASMNADHALWDGNLDTRRAVFSGHRWAA